MARVSNLEFRFEPPHAIPISKANCSCNSATRVAASPSMWTGVSDAKSCRQLRQTQILPKAGSSSSKRTDTPHSRQQSDKTAVCNLAEANETKTPVSTKVGRFRETDRAVLHGGAERVSIQQFLGLYDEIQSEAPQIPNRLSGPFRRHAQQWFVRPPVQCRDVNVRSNEGEERLEVLGRARARAG
jgi:hypothetical protein